MSESAQKVKDGIRSLEPELPGRWVVSCPRWFLRPELWASTKVVCALTEPYLQFLAFYFVLRQDLTWLACNFLYRSSWPELTEICLPLFPNYWNQKDIPLCSV